MDTPMCLAVPGKIVSVIEDEQPHLRRGKVDFGGVLKEICLAYTPEAGVGDYVLVHVGFALNRIDEAEAQRILDTFREMDELEQAQAEAGGDAV
jgi:hydrogenase expression/formation protein HypC